MGGTIIKQHKLNDIELRPISFFSSADAAAAPVTVTAAAPVTVTATATATAGDASADAATGFSPSPSARSDCTGENGANGVHLAASLVASRPVNSPVVPLLLPPPLPATMVLQRPGRMTRTASKVQKNPGDCRGTCQTSKK